MNLTNVLNNTVKVIKSNSPEILTALGISGLVTTAYLTAKATFKAAEIINHEQYQEDQKEKSHPLDNREKARLVWKCYIPPSIAGTFAIGCIVGATHVTGKRTAAAVTAYSITEKAFSEYREKVVEQIGKGKEQKIRDEIAQDRVNQLPPVSREVILTGAGQVLCCELFTHRYFRSDMPTLQKAEIEINMRIINDIYVTLEEFYDIINLPHTSVSDNLGWDSSKTMKLEFSTILSEDGEPCLAFDYNYTKPLRG